ncbi:MAG: restriction endonuclease subunit S [Methylococcales bacterium]
MKQLITDNLAIWTTAPKGIKKLRELILELAVRGLLVPQDPTDEPASELLKKIAAEKARLVSEGKIKSPKPLAKISEEEKPFDLPMGWEWARLGDVTNYGACDKAESTDVDEQTWVLELEDVEKETSRLIKKVRFVEKQFKSSKNRFLAGDVIYGKLRPYLDKVLVADEAGVCTTEMIPIRGYSSIVPEFLRLTLKSSYFINYADNSTHGMSLPRMGTEKAQLALIPILSEPEQQRIVAKVDELMQLCDRLEQKQNGSQAMHRQLVSCLLTTLTEATDAQAFQAAWSRIAANFDCLFTTEHSIEQLKQTILQLAVMGKLVPQNPTDEPASELLKKIATEKARLITEGKIKKQNPLPKISEQEKPFVLPNGWEWTHMINCAKQITDGEHLTPQRTLDFTQIPLVTAKNVRDGAMDYTNTDYVDLDVATKCWNRCKPEPNNILIVSVGATIGRLTIIDDHRDMVIVRSVTLVKPLSINIPYLALSLRSPYMQKSIWRGVKQNAQPCLYLSVSNSLLIPLPPFAEQHRIVTKVDELMTLCEQLKTKLATTQTLQQQLADTLVQQAVA